MSHFLRPGPGAVGGCCAHSPHTTVFIIVTTCFAIRARATQNHQITSGQHSTFQNVRSVCGTICHVKTVSKQKGFINVLVKSAFKFWEIIKGKELLPFPARHGGSVRPCVESDGGRAAGII